MYACVCRHFYFLKGINVCITYIHTVNYFYTGYICMNSEMHAYRKGKGQDYTIRSSNCRRYQARIVYSTLLQSFRNSARSEESSVRKKSRWNTSRSRQKLENCKTKHKQNTHIQIPWIWKAGEAFQIQRLEFNDAGNQVNINMHLIQNRNKKKKMEKNWNMIKFGYKNPCKSSNIYQETCFQKTYLDSNIQEQWLKLDTRSDRGPG